MYLKRVVPVLTLLALVAGAMIAPAANAVAKPDLVVTTRDFYRLLDLEEEHWVLRGEPYELTWEAKVKNIGNARAVPSAVALQIKRSGSWVFLNGQVVPRIPAGQARSVKESFSKTFGRANWLFGKYPLRICVDFTHLVAESNEGNNCRLLTATPLYIIPGTFDGSVSGEAGPESWSGSIHLDLTEYGADGYEGRFYYTVDEQSGLDYTASGAYFDCTATGSGHIEPLHTEHLGQTLEMNFKTRMYDIYDYLPFAPTSTYPVHLQCPEGPGEWEGPLFGDEWIRTGYQPRGFASGFTALEGQFIVDLVPPVSYSWDLQADVP